MVTLAPIAAPTKADAIDAFAAQFPPGPLLFAGDDETDEDAFRSPLVAHGIRIGRSEGSAARYFLEGQGEVESLLRTLVSERAHLAGPCDGWQDLDPSRGRGGLG